MAVEDLRVMGRATQGVKLINLKNNDSIAAVAKVMHDEDDIDQVEEINENTDSNNGTAIDKTQDENNL
jgi:DNA gyrase subunit A